MRRIDGFSPCRFSGICTAILVPILIAAGRADAAGHGVEAADPLARIEATYDATRGITWYVPDHDQWKAFDLRVLPVIARSDDGARKFGLRLILKDPPKGRPNALHVNVDGGTSTTSIPPDVEIVTSKPGCRTTQTLFLQDQEPVIRALAGARTADILITGYRRNVKHRLFGRDLEPIRRMAVLWDRSELPPAPPEKNPPRGQPPGGPYFAHDPAAGITVPEIIPSTKVTPRFPRTAQGSNVLGRVVLQAVVRKDGSVDVVEVTQPAGGDCGFEEAAIDAVKRWRYKPGTKDGAPVDVYFTIVIDFTYRDFRIAR